MLTVAREMDCAYIWYAHAAAARGSLTGRPKARLKLIRACLNIPEGDRDNSRGQSEGSKET